MSVLAGLRILRADVHVPPSGGSFATTYLDASTLPALGRATLVVGDFVSVGSIIRTDWDDHPGGGLVMAVFQGGAGWDLPVVRAGRYDASSGVRLSTVLTDIAVQSGEAFDAPADRPLGVGYQWEAHTPQAPVHCRDILNDLVSRGYLSTWRIDPTTGRTRFDAWPARGAADGRGRITSRSGARGKRVVGLDVQVAAFLPGATLEGISIRRTIIREDAQALAAEVYSA